LQSLLKTNLSLDSPIPEARSGEDFDVRSKASIHLGHDCYDDTYFDGLEVLSDPSSPFTPLLETSTSLDTSLPLAPLGELEDRDEFETDAYLNDQCGILVESEDTFFKEHSLDEPCVVHFSEVCLLMSFIPFLLSLPMT